MTASDRITRVGMALVAVAVLVLMWTCQQPVGEPTANIEEMKELVNRQLPIWNEGNLDLIEELFAPEFVRHHVDAGEDVVGVDAMKEYVTALRTGFPDFQVAFDEMIVAGDRIVTRWTVTGTQTGPYQGEPPTGKAIQVSGVGIGRVVDGKSVEEWNYWNNLAVWQQLGYTLTPPAEATAAE